VISFEKTIAETENGGKRAGKRGACEGREENRGTNSAWVMGKIPRKEGG